MQHSGLILTLSAPSGTGKSTVSERLLATNLNLSLSISATSREPRAGEVNGKDYIFLSPAEFEAKIAAEEFLEWTSIHGNYYGTLKSEVYKNIEAGNNMLFDVNWQGVNALKEVVGDNLVSICLLPPSYEELKRRLVTRASDSEESLRKRLNTAKSELDYVGVFDYIVVNQDLDVTCNVIRSIITAETHKQLRSTYLPELIADLRSSL